jgi:hypothetical protein
MECAGWAIYQGKMTFGSGFGVITFDDKIAPAGMEVL